MKTGKASTVKKRTMTLTAEEKSELLTALSFRADDFINYTKKDIKEHPEIGEITETLADLILKVMAIEPSNKVQAVNTSNN
jgi:hypothetical protein